MPPRPPAARTPASRPPGQSIHGDLLTRYGGRLVRLRPGQTLFDQGEPADDFFQVAGGRIRMVVYSGRGKEFTQGFFGPGESFGEPPFFCDESYPASAVAEEESQVWRVPREGFMRLLRENPEAHLAVTRTLSRRLVYKSMMLSEIATAEAEHRLATLIRYLRRERRDPASAPYRVPFTRQQLADMTGLRVETVIRTVKAMEARGALRIVAGRIVWNDARGAELYEE